MTLEDRQRQTSFERRSSWAPQWATSGERNLYAVEQAVEEARKRAAALSALAEMDADLIDYETQLALAARARQSCADMADLIEHAKQGEFREAD